MTTPTPGAGSPGSGVAGGVLAAVGALALIATVLALVLAFGPAGRDDAGARVHEVKDIRSGEQHAADPADWTPPAEDLLPQVARAQG